MHDRRRGLRRRTTRTQVEDSKGRDACLSEGRNIRPATYLRLLPPVGIRNLSPCCIRQRRAEIGRKNRSTWLAMMSCSAGCLSPIKNVEHWVPVSF